MILTYSDTPQGTPEWLEERAGRLTASVAKTMMGKEGATLTKLIDELATERAYGYDHDAVRYKNDAMQRGNDLEPEARAAFCFEHDRDVTEVGLALNSDYPGAGASLDGLIIPDMKVAVEIKCPATRGKVHRYAEEERCPLDYRHQLVFQMMICNLDAVHFWAWHPTCKPFHILIERDEDAVLDMAERYREINAMIDIQAERERER